MTEKDLRKEISSRVAEFYEKTHKNQEFRPGIDLVHYAGRVFSEEEIQLAVEACLDFKLTSGRFTKQFEERFAQITQKKHAIFVNSGSSANLAAITTIAAPEWENTKKYVITTAAGFPTTLAPILQNNLIPVFIDIELGTYNADTAVVAEAIEMFPNDIKAVFLPHTLGVPLDMGPLFSILANKDIWLVTDACDALDSLYMGLPVGSFPGEHLTTYSFFPAHHITTGQGGCVTANNDAVAAVCRSIVEWGRACKCRPGQNNVCGQRFEGQFGELPVGYDHKYVYNHIGYNLAPTDIQAAIGCAQLNKLEEFTHARRYNHGRIHQILSKYADRLYLHESPVVSEPSWFCYVITVKENAGFTKNELVQFLEANKIETRSFFGGNLLKQPAFQDIAYHRVGSLTNTNYCMENTFFIGVYPGIKEEHLNWIEDTFKRFMETH